MTRPIVISCIAPLVLLGLSACGTRSALEPVDGASLPPAPHGQDTTVSAEELLKAPTLARPERSVELRRRSEEREDDPFDLPPE